MKVLLKRVYQNSNYGYLLRPFKKLYDFYRFRLLPERVYIKDKYKEKFGRYPNLDNPVLLSEKIQWLKLNDRTELHTKCADKYKVREYVESVIGSKYLIPLVLQTKNVDDIRFDNFPDYPVIVKVNHDSGGTFVIKDKHAINFEQIRKVLKETLKRNYYYTSREWVYKNIEKRIIIEKLMLDESGFLPNDIKIHCFNGKVEFVEIMTDRGSEGGVKEHCLNKFFQKQPFLFSYPQSNKKLIKPARWEEGMALAEKLATPFKYVRVDFYDVFEELYFGELTFAPHSGYNMYLQPREWDKKLGEMLNLETEV